MNKIDYNINKQKETPLIQQYNYIKYKYPNTIILFQVGDFYEIFGKDAIICSKILNIILTKKSNNINLSGFPCHSINTYLPKLIKAGLRVAICDQLEEAQKGKKLVKRGVTKVITPGTAIDENIINEKCNNFLASIHTNDKNDMFGMSLLDLSTGEFFVIEDNEKNILQYLYIFNPKEILLQRKKKKFFVEILKKNFNPSYFIIDDWLYNYSISYNKILSHFKIYSLKGFGIEKLKLAIITCGIIFFYLQEKCCLNELHHISKIQNIKKEEFMWINDYTFKNLEIFLPFHNNGKSLIDILDKTHTAMGSRLLKKWIMFPLINILDINKRYKIVEYIYKDSYLRTKLSKSLKNICDIERTISKIVSKKISPREIISLSTTISYIEKIRKKILELKIKKNVNLYLKKDICNCSYISKHINNTINIKCSSQIEKGKNNVILKGVSKELDDIRSFYINQKEYLYNICLKERRKSGIKNLKIRYHSILGYFIEINKRDKNKILKYWIQKQILSNTERYITAELKQYELNIFNAEQKIFNLEKEIFQKLINTILNSINKLQENSKIIAEIDVLSNFAKIALINNYTKPKLNKYNNLSIIKGRHPVIEKQFLEENTYIPNDINFNKINKQIIIITGPNMSGKSAILRQTAIIILMSHIGSFIPAKCADICIIDKIFSRIGASDNISIGESTFMMEMQETANILNNITSRSFVILDEIGRGTGIFDGISISYSIIKFLHESKFKPLTLFATHYNEIIHIFPNFYRIKKYFISVKKIKENIIFMRKLIPGYSKYSFGIYIAKIAGIPLKVIETSNKILKLIKNSNINQCFFCSKKRIE